jgi:hypothetical protein
MALLERHPHRRRLPRHARHLIRQMLKPRVAMRAGTLQTHAMQLDSAVNLAEYPDRVHPDRDRYAPGVRVVVGPETRSLLRQLLDSRDLRVQQQLVREIIHQLQKRVIAAAKRAARMETARKLAGRAVRSARRSRLWAWFRTLPARARDKVSGRTTRTVGNRKPTVRTRSKPADPVSRTTRTPAAPRTTRARKPPADRTERPRT